jgi:gliding motility-associated protein GldM
MGHGKETPRQKMIGMMYLVLMAMLALNVSNQVLNAFDVLDEGLGKTMETLEATNEKMIADFEVQYELNPTKVEPWKIKAQQVQEKGDEIVKFIQDSKIEILTSADELEAIDEHGNINGALIKGKDKTDAPAFIMIGDNNDKAGKELKEKIEEYRNFLIHEIVDAESAEAIRHSIESGLDTEPGGGHGEGGGGHGDTEMHSWEREHFEHLPMSGVITIMTGLQINVRNAQSEALKYLYSQIDAGSFKFNRLSATVIPNSNYIIKGNDYKAEVFLAASDTTASPTIYVTTDPRPYDSTIVDGVPMYSRREGVKYDTLTVAKGSGKGLYTQPTTSLGTKSWGGLIELTGPDGSTIVKPFKKEYLVAEGSVTVAPTKMNVFYLGVDNPVDVSVAGIQPDRIDISVTNARHVKKGDSYIIRPIRPGNAYVVVYANIEGERREMGRKEFRVKTVPNPVAMVNGHKGGAISQGVLLAQLGVVAEMENFDFDLKFTITEFTVSAVVQGFVREYTSKSNRFTPEQKNLIKNLSRGNNVYIQDIKAVGPDGSTRPLSTINFRLN